MSPRVRIAIIAGAVVALVVAFVVARGSDDQQSAATAPASTPAATVEPTTATQTTTTTPPAPSLPVVRVVNAKPQGGIERLTFKKGGRVAFSVRSDTADEIHVHGYDVHKDVKAGGSVTFDFPARIDGRFVVELENHGTQIAQLEVTP